MPRGGARKGAGPKPRLSPDAPGVHYAFRLPREMREAVQERGGGAWLRQLITRELGSLDSRVTPAETEIDMATATDFQTKITPEQAASKTDPVLIGWAGKPWRKGERATAVWQFGDLVVMHEADKWEGPIAPDTRAGRDAYPSLEKLKEFLAWRSPRESFSPVQ